MPDDDRDRLAPKPHQRLVESVHSALATRLGGEFIDELKIQADRRDSKRADFLLLDRTVIVEIKEVIDDRIEKIRRVLDFERRIWDWPLHSPGEWLQSILERHPRGAEINVRLRDINLKMTEKLVKDANRQIRDTRATFGLPDSIGILLVVNEHVDVLDPRVLCMQLHHLLYKRQPSGGRLRFPEIDMALLITVAHSVLDPRGTSHPGIFAVRRPDDPRFDRIDAITKQLIGAWAEAIGVPLIDWGSLTSPEQVQRLEFEGRQPPLWI